MSLLPIECPKCEAPGSVGFDAVGRTLHCKKCGASFYLNSTGQTRLGEAPKPGEQEKMTSGEVASALFEGVKESLAANWVALLIFLVVGGAAVVGGALYLRASTRDTSKDRALAVARLLADNDPERLREMAMKETGDDAATWLTRTRNALQLMGNSKNYLLTAEFYQGDLAKGSADFMVTLLPTQSFPAAGSGDSAPSSIPPVIIHMVRDSGRAWEFDGTRSLEMAPMEQKARGGRNASAISRGARASR